MNFSVNSVIAGVLFGILGMILFREGKRRTNAELYFVAVGLMLYPYFISDDILVWVVGFALTGIALAILKRG